MSFLAGALGGILRTVGGSVLASVSKPLMGGAMNLLGKVVKPVTSLLKPIGNTISKWMGADFLEDQFSNVGRMVDEKLPHAMQVIPGQSVGDVLRDGLQAGYKKALGFVGNKAGQLVERVGNKLGQPYSTGGEGGGQGIEKQEHHGLNMQIDSSSLPNIAHSFGNNLLGLAKQQLMHQASGANGGSTMQGLGQMLYQGMAQRLSAL